MTQRNKVKISGDLKSYRPKSKYHKPIMEGYGFQNGDFVFSDDYPGMVAGEDTT